MNDTSKVKSICMDAEEIERSLTRIAHQILESNKGAANIALVGIVTRGDLLAKKLVEKIESIEGTKVPYGRLDISFYRDDYATHFAPKSWARKWTSTSTVRISSWWTTSSTPVAPSAPRSMRSWTLAVRPTVQLAVLVDRGHRELPIRADYVGKNVPSSSDENVRLFLEEVDGVSAVEILEVKPGSRAGSAPLGGE